MTACFCTRILLPLLLILPFLAGCSETDPFERAGMWQPTGANSRNLAAMVQNPNDLLRGHGERGNSGYEGATPVLRLWAGRPATLPVSGSQGSAVTAAASPAAPNSNTN